MKNFLLLSLIVTVLFGCKEDEEMGKLMKMKSELSHDWQLYSHETIEPLKFRRNHGLDPCNKIATWSFDETGYFSITEDLTCNPYLYVLEGTWKMENTKALQVDLTQIKVGLVDPTVTKQSGWWNFRIEKISADTLKLTQDALIFDADINSTISGVDKFTLIRK